MPKEQLSRYTCDQCDMSIIVDNVPDGWFWLRSKRENHALPYPPEIFTRGGSGKIPKDACWCSPDCMAAWIRDTASSMLVRRRPRSEIT